MGAPRGAFARPPSPPLLGWSPWAGRRARRTTDPLPCSQKVPGGTESQVSAVALTQLPVPIHRAACA